jgi:hypothetical protein
MPQIVHQCHECNTELQTDLPITQAPECPGCRQRVELRPTASVQNGGLIDLCAACGHPDLYVQKDFNRGLGIAIVVIGMGICLYFFIIDLPFIAMAGLVAMAVVDAAIYVVVGSVTVCYACHAIYRKFPRNPAHRQFNLELLERHGGEDPRF